MATSNNRSVELLNKALGDELSAIHQYMFFHFHLDAQGFDLLATLFKRTAIDEMRHIEVLADRILFLKGDIEMKATHEVQSKTDVKEMLQLAREMEIESARDYNSWANECSANADAMSKQLFENLVAEEEKHSNQYDTELENIERFGASYLALQSIERSKANSASGSE